MKLTATAGWVALFLLFSGEVLMADTATIPISSFLAAAREDAVIGSHTEIVSTLENGPSEIPFLDEVEFRVRNDGFKFDRQRYSLRISPRSWGETRKADRVHAAMLEYAKDRRSLLQHRRLKKRYSLVVEFLNQTAVLNLERQIKTLYEDRVTVLSRTINTSDFSMQKLIESEDDLTKATLRILGIENRLFKLGWEIRRNLPVSGPVVFDTAQLISMEGIRTFLAQNSFDLDTNNVYLAESGSNLRLAKARQELEQASGRGLLSFLQVSYDRDNYLDELEDKQRGRRYDLRNSYSMEVGVTIPYLNADRIDIQRRRADQLAEKGRHADLQTYLNEQIGLTANRLKTLLDQYDLLMKRRMEVQTDSSLRTISQVAGYDPLIILDAKESILLREITIEKTQSDIYDAYLDLLDAMGKLQDEPIRNYLSKDIEVIGHE